VVEILSPRDDSLLPAGPWTLKLRLHDWPLVDGGELGAGPHLKVQIDQEPPQIWTRLEGTLPPLSPGSHRLTVYAAMPWGEALKNPGAMQQIRLHRTAANPLSLPAPGTPQLLPVSPSGIASGEPLLLDWLLLDAPLQNLRGDGNQWRLRAQINGDAVLLDQQTPLWLRGWKSGRNALQLELLDGRGEPLNPPFNSLVLEVERSPSAPRPRWLGDRLSPQELAVLLGQTPPEPPPAPPEPTPMPVAPPEATPIPEAAPAAAPEAAADAAAAAAPVPPPTPQPAEVPAAEEPSAPGPTETAAMQPEAVPEAQTVTPSAIANPEAPPPELSAAPPASPTGPADAAASPAEAPEPTPQPAAPVETRIVTSTSLEGRARDLVNADGTLRQPPAPSPLDRLQSMLQR
jgi:hypothetical protein